MPEPKVNQNAIDNMSDKAKDAVKNGPSPVAEVVDPGPNIIRDVPSETGGYYDNILAGTAGEVDYFVFDMNVSEGSPAMHSGAIITGFEEGDKIFVVNADGDQVLNEYINTGLVGDGTTPPDSVFAHVERDPGYDDYDIVFVTVVDYQLAWTDLWIVANDPFAVA